jgi:hypothetical protein
MLEKRHLENRHVRIKFMASELKISAIGARTARGRLQRQQERNSREPRLTGGVPLGTFKSRSTAHQIEVVWR